MKKTLLLGFFIFTVFLAGCETVIPKDALILKPETLEDRQIQTRYFDTNDEAKILSACAALLQDLGFNLDESESEVGFILGSKDRSAVDAGQVVGAILYAALTGAYLPTDRNQKMKACVITRPISENRTAVRVTFQRVVWNDYGQITKREGMLDPKQYQEFFEKLSKTVFLEAHQL
ncbi:MAG: hypothetical protein HZA01_16170 [Nitrospinae bacterium]|nr:hypothetical protein [Nitrospinota bacterium]